MEVHVSISHLTDHATAIVVIEDGPRGTILDMDGLRAASVFAESLHVVVWHGRNLNSPAQWAARRPPPEKPLPTQLEIRQAIQSLELVAEKLVEQQRERLREQLLERLHELLAVQLSVQPAIEVEVQLTARYSGDDTRADTSRNTGQDTSRRTWRHASRDTRNAPTHRSAELCGLVKLDSLASA